MPNYLHHLVHYNTWANRGLLGFLGAQPESILALTAAGVYGTIGETFEHLLSSEISYHRKLLSLPKTEYLQPEAPTMNSLIELSAIAAAKLGGLVDSLPNPERMLHLDDGDRSAATVFTQLVMHSIEHRAHIGTILGANNIRGLELDAWAHGIFAHNDDWYTEWGPEPGVRAEFPTLDQR